MVTPTTCPKTRDLEHARRRFHPSTGRPSEAFVPGSSLKGYLRAYLRTLTEKKEAEPEAPERLSLGSIIKALKNTPHKLYEPPEEALEAFDRFLQKINEEPEDESREVIRDASSEHDKYIYEERRH